MRVRLDDGSGVNREVHAPFCERLGAKLPGSTHLAKAAVPHMVRQRWGRVINIMMNHDTMRRADFSPYGPSKAASSPASVGRLCIMPLA